MCQNGGVSEDVSQNETQTPAEKLKNGLSAPDKSLHDKSLKGSIDKPLRRIVNLLNKDARFFTTSCCSGRVAAFLESSDGRKKNGKLLFVSHGLFPTNDPDICPGWDTLDMRLNESASESTKIRTAEDLGHVSVNNVVFMDEVYKSISSKENVYQPLKETTLGKEAMLHPDAALLNGVLWLNVEPFVIHVECIDLEACDYLLSIARQAGLKNSGVLTLGRRLLVAIRGAQRLHAPLLRLVDGSNTEQFVSDEYLNILLSFASRRLIKNWLQISRFQFLLSKQLTNDESCCAPSTPPPCFLKSQDSSENSKRSQTHPALAPIESFIKWHPFQGPPSIARLQAAASCMIDALCIVFGGGSPEGRLNSLNILDMGTQTWVDNLRVTSEEPDGSFPEPRQAAQLVSLNRPGLAVLFGGRTNPKNPLNDLWLLKRVDQKGTVWSWKLVNPSGFSSPCARYRHALTCVSSDDLSSETLILHGGVGYGNSSSIALSDLWALQVKFESASLASHVVFASWNQLPQLGFYPGFLHSHSLFSFDKYVLVLGGASPGFSLHSADSSDEKRNYLLDDSCEKLQTTWKSLFAYDLFSSHWGMMAASSIEFPSSGRFGHAACCHGNRCLVVGGCGKKGFADEIWELRTQIDDGDLQLSWKLVGSLPSDRCQIKAVAAWDGQSTIFLIGGGMICYGFGPFFNSPLKGIISNSQPVSQEPAALEDCPSQNIAKPLWAVVKHSKQNISGIKHALEFFEALDRSRSLLLWCDEVSALKLGFHDSDSFKDAVAFIPMSLPRIALPPGLELREKHFVITGAAEALVPLDGVEIVEFSFESREGTEIEPSGKQSMREKLRQVLLKHLPAIQEATYGTTAGYNNVDDIAPTKWERLGDVILFQQGFLEGAEEIAELWKELEITLKCRAVGVLGRVTGDKRFSGARIMGGHSGVVLHPENNVAYLFDLTRCMFSSGNGTERARIGRRLSTHGSQEIFVDFFCGIGYFTLPVLVKCCPKTVAEVWACDWNDTATNDAVKLNKIQSPSRLRILHGDSRQLGLPNGPDNGRLMRRATCISLGLIPSSEESWIAAARLASPEGCVMHVHGLAKKREGDQFAKCVVEKFQDFFRTEEHLESSKGQILERKGIWKVTVDHIERVKSYSPILYHFVIDIVCKEDGDCC